MYSQVTVTFPDQDEELGSNPFLESSNDFTYTESMDMVQEDGGESETLSFSATKILAYESSNHSDMMIKPPLEFIQEQSTASSFGKVDRLEESCLSVFSK